MNSAFDPELEEIARASDRPTYNTAAEKYQEALTNQQRLFDQNRGSFNEREWRGMNQSYRDASFTDGLGVVLERAFNGVPQNVEDATGIPRTMTGGAGAFRSLTTYLDSRPEDAQRVLGTDGRLALYKMAHLTSNPEDAVKANSILKEMGRVLRHHGHGIGPIAAGGIYGGPMVMGAMLGGFKGAVAGAAVGAVYKMALFKAATNPLIADRMAYAVQHNIAPRVAGPILAAMMLRAHRDATPPPAQEPQ